MHSNLCFGSAVVFGKNCVENNKNKLSDLGKKCLIVTSKSGAKKSGALIDVVNALESIGIEYSIFNKITENPLVSTVIEGGKAARDMGAEFIIGIGGGSPLDASKAVAICACNPEYDIDGLYGRKVPSKALPVVLVGTTAGTGSEVTGVSVLTNDKTMMKKSIGGADCYATLVFADPKYTYSMSFDITASTALDAYAHAAEGWFSKRCTDEARVYARKAFPLVFKGLKFMAETGEIPDADLRDEMFYGALYAGMELNICGAAFPHTVGYVLTENFGIPHGKACTAFTDYFMKKAKANEGERYTELLKIIGCEESELLAVINKLTNIKGLNITEDKADEWCSRWKNITMKNFDNSPGGLTADEAKEALMSL